MSNTRLSFRVAAFRFVVLALTGAGLFTVASIGTGAAPSSFTDSVSTFLSPAAEAASVKRQDSPANLIGNPVPTPPELSPESGGGREFRGVEVSGDPDTFVLYAVELISQGDETVTGFSLQFDQTRLSISNVSGFNNNPDVIVGTGANLGTPRVVNALQIAMGRIGVLLDFQSALPAGTRQIVVFRFRILPGVPGGLTPITFVEEPIARSATNADRDDLPAKYTPSNVNVTNGGPPPTPSISGIVSYGTTPVGQGTKFVPGVLLTAAGSTPVNATTDAAGAYLLTGFGPGPYTVTPSKSGDVNGISALDASQVAQHVAGLIVLTPNQIIAGDATNNGSLSPLDASRIAEFAAGMANPGITGTWKFVPPSRTYPSVTGPITNQNYEAILVGDVTGNWTPPAVPRTTRDLASKIPDAGQLSFIDRQIWNGKDQKSDDVINVDLPNAVATEAKTALTLPIAIGDTTGKGLVAYEFTIDFDPTVLTPNLEAATTAGTLSEGWSVTVNSAIPGQITVVAYSTQELTGAGTLLCLNFTVIGKSGATTPLKWTRFELNENKVSTDHY